MGSSRNKRRSKRPQKAETRSAEVLTIGWMLLVVTTLVCETGFLVGRWLLLRRPGSPLDVLVELLLFAAFIIGFFSLLLTPVVVKSRRTPPPRGIIVFALVVGAAPLLTMVLQILD